MASNQVRYVGNVYGAPGPFKFKGKFQAGASAAVKRGEFLELSGGNWIPLDADQSMAAVIAISDCEIKSGDLAGYHEIIVPRPGDIFEVTLTAADNSAAGTALYWSTSQILATTGSNILGHTCDDSILPSQGFQSSNVTPDAGTTIRYTTAVRMTVRAAASYYAALQL